MLIAFLIVAAAAAALYFGATADRTTAERIPVRVRTHDPRERRR